MRHLFQRWHEYRPTKKQTFWVAAGCVTATLVLGFGYGGWVTGATAQARADEAADASYQQLAAAVCKENFLRAADSRGRLAKLQDTQYWERDDLIASGGWATMPGENEASMAVAGLCATQLGEHAEASARTAPLSAVSAAR